VKHLTYWISGIARIWCEKGRKTNRIQEYVLWNVVSVPLLQFAWYCSTAQTLSLKYIRVATHDVIGHVTTLFAVFDFLCVLYWN